MQNLIVFLKIIQNIKTVKGSSELSDKNIDVNNLKNDGSIQEPSLCFLNDCSSISDVFLGLPISEYKIGTDKIPTVENLFDDFIQLENETENISNTKISPLDSLEISLKDQNEKTTSDDVLTFQNFDKNMTTEAQSIVETGHPYVHSASSDISKNSGLDPKISGQVSTAGIDNTWKQIPQNFRKMRTEPSDYLDLIFQTDHSAKRTEPKSKNAHGHNNHSKLCNRRHAYKLSRYQPGYSRSPKKFDNVRGQAVSQQKKNVDDNSSEAKSGKSILEFLLTCKIDKKCCPSNKSHKNLRSESDKK